MYAYSKSDLKRHLCTILYNNTNIYKQIHNIQLETRQNSAKSLNINKTYTCILVAKKYRIMTTCISSTPEINLQIMDLYGFLNYFSNTGIFMFVIF